MTMLWVKNTVCTVFLLSTISYVSGQGTNLADANSTSADNTTLSQPSTTTTTSTVTTKPTTTAAAKVSSLDTNTKTIFCTCDITVSVCDTNCCCDRDCNADDQLTFTTCLEVLNQIPGKKYCLAARNLFLFNTKYEVGEEDGLFCVSREITTSDFYVTPDTIKTQKDYEKYNVNERSQFSYSTPSQASDSPFNASATSYKSGDCIATVTKQGIVSAFQVPSEHSATGACVDHTPAKFLKDTRITCTRSLDAPLSSLCISWTAPSQTATTEILQSSLISFQSEQPISSPELDPVSEMCHNVIIGVDYEIFHTSGVIDSIKVSYTTRNFTNTTQSIQQAFSVTYRADNSTVPLSSMRSGNPGYLVEYPVIAGWRKSADTIELSYDGDSYMSVLLSAQNGVCDVTARQSVLFGVNSVSGCHLSGEYLPSSCQNNIQAAYDLLVDQSLNSSIYIASFGDTLMSELGDWVPLLRTESPTDVACSGVTMTLEIFYSKVGATSNPQSRIIGAKLKFTADTLLNYDLHTPRKFSLTSVVNFIDLTEAPPAQTAGQPDHLHSEKSEIDFFYPFVYALSSSSHISQNIEVCIFIFLAYIISSL